MRMKDEIRGYYRPEGRSYPYANAKPEPTCAQRTANYVPAMISARIITATMPTKRGNIQGLRRFDEELKQALRARHPGAAYPSKRQGNRAGRRDEQRRTIGNKGAELFGQANGVHALAKTSGGDDDGDDVGQGVAGAFEEGAGRIPSAGAAHQGRQHHADEHSRPNQSAIKMKQVFRLVDINQPAFGDRNYLQWGAGQEEQRDGN